MKPCTIKIITAMIMEVIFFGCVVTNIIYPNNTDVLSVSIFQYQEPMHECRICVPVNYQLFICLWVVMNLYRIETIHTDY